MREDNEKGSKKSDQEKNPIVLGFFRLLLTDFGLLGVPY